ncbi:2,3-diaminopropionate biosynthesis protein SbnA [Spirillospora sp. NPDC047279]|uniref:2,3-diaminopropionate biosynthesis protein SbnA n=1 Tax=Spirillospora sp. NPDC047279 TaxID=3155478 RepID=UPI0033F8635D
MGNTPLVRLERLYPAFPGRVFAKLESFNPGGSVKDRSALSLLRERIENGDLIPGESTVVESSSGNLAIGLAQICRYFDIHFLCVVDAKTSVQNIAILKSFGAEVEVVTEPDPHNGEYLPARLRRVRELLAANPRAYCPDQYSNPLNPRAHEETMREIAAALDGGVDHLFCAVSTFGTLRGCARYVAEAGLSTRIWAVDAVGSAIFGQRPRPRLIPGHGASVRPALFEEGHADEVVHVTDLECVVACRRLVQREAILAGGSSGATTAALEKAAPHVGPGEVCVLIYPDGGDRYLDTIHSDAWVRDHFGEVAHLWKTDER